MFHNNKRILLAFLIILIYVAPYFILGQNAHVRIHDNLDSNVAWYRILGHSSTLFAPIGTTIPQIINGLPRGDLYSQFYGIVLLNVYLPPMVAYGLNELITRVFAFIGMYLLLKDHFFKKDASSIILVGTALTFALIPFWPSGMLSQLGMPLALWAFLNIRARKSTWRDYLILTLLPFYSTFVLGFFFFLSVMGVLWLVDVIRKKAWNWRFFFSIAYMTIIYLAIEYRLVFSLLLPHEPTSRTEFVESTLSLQHTLLLFLKNLVIGHNQDQDLHTPIILPLVLLVIVMIWRKGLWKNEKTLVWLSALYAILSLWYAFWFYKGWEPLKGAFTLLTTFNFSRYHYLHPMIIYIVFALALHFIWKKGKIGRRIVKILIVLQLFVLFGFNDQIRYHNEPTFKQFYAIQQFQDIKSYINKPVSSYRIASIGIHPAIAQYNGFYTLDTYNNFYPLSYKHKFREIIAKELDKNKMLKNYYDNWGSRCYIFVDELGKNYMFTKDSNKQIDNLELNIKPFKKMGGEYIFSALPIEHPEKTGLKLEKIFRSDESAWTIYLYKVRSATKA
ncbi:DUF6044 family protein [Scopulibacillus darangshiensis]|nr:DUF6044 family protein [Scopulibacillus darangshiensis]